MMCGRITQQLSPDQICDLYSLRATPLPPDRPPRYNGAPGQDFTALPGRAARQPRDRPAALRFGALLGARRQHPFPAHPCPRRVRPLQARFPSTPLPATRRWLVRVATKRPPQEALFPDPQGRLAAVVRRAVGALGPRRLAARDLHHRHPAIIDPRWFSNWLDPRTPLLVLLELARQPHDGPFQRRAVSARVNSVRNDDPDILLPVPESEMF